jgi:hypothetical protein
MGLPDARLRGHDAEEFGFLLGITIATLPVLMQRRQGRFRVPVYDFQQNTKIISLLDTIKETSVQ